MLIDQLSGVLKRSGALANFWGKLDGGQDAALGVASSARAFLVASRFCIAPQTTLVVLAGEDAAHSFARSLSAYLPDGCVFRFPERQDSPYNNKLALSQVVAMRNEALHALVTGKPCVVVASARALLRKSVLKMMKVNCLSA